MRMERQVYVGVVELCVGIGLRAEGRCNGSARDIRSGSKGAGWMILGKEHNLGRGWQRGINWYQVQSGRKRGTSQEVDIEHWTLDVNRKT